MNGRFLLDTSVVIDLLGERRETVAALEALPHLLLSGVAMGELFYGALRSPNPARSVVRVRAFAERRHFLLIDGTTGLHYAHIKNYLREQGTPIPDNDMWIAALAIQHDVGLLTSDNHFTRVPGLRVTNPRLAAPD